MNKQAGHAVQKLKVLDLFSGIGGFSLGLERTGGFETVAFCEIEEFPRKVLRKHWPDVPQFTDVKELRGEHVGTVDVICGGYPCQPFSTAGKRRGQKDDRHLWPEFMRLVVELRPSWVIGENVAGHISMGLDDVLSDLEGEGYACRTFVVPACALGAHHRRDRCWTIAQTPALEHSAGPGKGRCPQSRKSSSADQASSRLEQGRDALVAHAESERRSEARELVCGQSKRPAGTSTASSDVADAQCIGSQTRLSSDAGTITKENGARRSEYDCPCRSSAQTTPHAHNAGSQGGVSDKELNSQGREKPGTRLATECSNWRNWDRACVWESEPDVGRVANGVSHRVDRLKALGNAVVPQIPEMIGYAILEAEAAQ